MTSFHKVECSLTTTLRRAENRGAYGSRFDHVMVGLHQKLR